MNKYFEVKKIKLTSMLTYAGAIPFILAAVLMYWDFERLPLIGDVQKLVDLYGLVIVVFIMGSHWGLSFNLLHIERKILMVISNFLTLSVLAAYVWLIDVPFQIILIVTLIIILGIDYWLYFRGINSQEYVVTRLIISIIVIISLYVVFSS